MTNEQRELIDKQRQDYVAKIAKIEKAQQRLAVERSAYINIVRGFHALLELKAPESENQPELFEETAVQHKPEETREKPPEKKPESVPEAIKAELQRTRGPLTEEQIWERIRPLGFETKQNPKWKVVHFAMYDMRKRGVPVERVDKGTWEWKGPRNDNGAQAAT